jgi:glyoxylase-like metal-dependent hydrolase (beta-lactamase superfamily II)
MKLEELGSGVTRFQSALYKTNSLVVQTEDLVLIVDPCWLPSEVDAIRSYVDDVADGRPLYLLFTHSDYDHILGYGAFPEAKVIASAAFAGKSAEEKEAAVGAMRAWDDDYYIERDYELTYPAADVVAGPDGDAFEVGGTRLTFYTAYGHNPDGLFTIVEPLGLWIAGDYLSDLEFPYIYYSSAEYEATLSKLDGILERHAIRLLLPGHGEPTASVEEMRRRQRSDLAYIHSMRSCLAAGDEAGIDALIAGCRFPRNMGKFHRNNRTLFEAEAGQG